MEVKTVNRVKSEEQETGRKGLTGRDHAVGLVWVERPELAWCWDIGHRDRWCFWSRGASRGAERHLSFSLLTWQPGQWGDLSGLTHRVPIRPGGRSRSPGSSSCCSLSPSSCHHRPLSSSPVVPSSVPSRYLRQSGGRIVPRFRSVMVIRTGR